MIITQEQYLQYLNELSNPGFKALTFPKGERIYKINLNTRTSEAPTFLSVKGDYEAETILFQVDRFFDNMDLSMANCVIQYTNAEGKGYLYHVPFYDRETLQEDGKLIIPWFIKDPVTRASGPIHYSFQFFQIDRDEIASYEEVKIKEEEYIPSFYYTYNEENKNYSLDMSTAYDKDKKYFKQYYKILGYAYNLNTQPVKSQVLHSLGLNRLDANQNEEPQVTILNEIYDELGKVQREILSWDIYWEEL